MSRGLIPSTRSVRPSAATAAAAKRRLATYAARSAASGTPAGRIPAMAWSRAQPRARAYASARPTPSRNSAARAGSQAIPRSPLAQSPAGRLKSATSTPASRAAAATAAAGCSYGDTNSTASKPARRAAAKRSRNGTSPNSIVRLAANLGTASPQEEHRAGTRAVRADDERLLDVGGLGRPGDEHAEARAGEGDPAVGLV